MILDQGDAHLPVPGLLEGHSVQKLVEQDPVGFLSLPACPFASSTISIRSEKPHTSMRNSRPRRLAGLSRRRRQICCTPCFKLTLWFSPKLICSASRSTTLCTTGSSSGAG